MELTDQIAGSIVGGAIGDGMGGPYEGHGPPVIVHYNLRWFLSGDTQLTLATCEAIGEFGTVSAELIADRFVRWFRLHRISAMGASTLKALADLATGVHWSMSGRKGEMAAGNGAAMRIAPLAFVLNPARETERELIYDVCRITHRNDEAYAGALAVVQAIRTVMQPGWNWQKNLAAEVLPILPDTKVRDRLKVIAGLDPQLSVCDVGRQFGCSGYVVESVPLALFGAQKMGSMKFGELMEHVIAAGGDADTNASITGQIAGAWLGYQQLPQDLIARLPCGEKTVEIVKEFAASVAALR